MTTINFKVSKLSSLKHLLPLHPPEPSCQSHLSKGQKENQIENILRIAVNINPAMGGDARDPTPHPRKNIGEMFPVTSTLLADQENNAPNCHETKNPIIAAHK